MNSHFVGKSDTKEEIKDLWRTPKSLFDALDDEFEFDLDACASDANALCHSYFCVYISCLNNDWYHSHDNVIRSAFINPPYSETSVFLERAAEQAKKHNITVVALVNANTDTKWFRNAVNSANEVRFITGRIAFVSPESERKACGNTRGQCIIVWRGRCKTACVMSIVNRGGLMDE